MDTAQESDKSIDRSELSAPEARREVLDRAVHLNYDNWQREVATYDGAVLVLFNSSCNIVEADIIDRNMEIVYLQLMDRFQNAQVNKLPIKFTVFDVCGRSKADWLGITCLETHMYLDGREIDRLRGGPISEEWGQEWYKFLSLQWIPTNLTAPNAQYAWRFEGTHDERKVSLKP